MYTAKLVGALEAAMNEIPFSGGRWDGGGMRDDINYTIKTFTGRMICIPEIKPGDVDLRDIAHSLSNQCRFNGHTTEFYSVAQHCVILSAMADEPRKPWALLHDAAEAYIGDIIRPVRNYFYPQIDELESIVLNAVAGRFRVNRVDVGDLDDALLQMEFCAVMRTGGRIPAYDTRIPPCRPAEAEQDFLAAAAGLGLSGQMEVL